MDRAPVLGKALPPRVHRSRGSVWLYFLVAYGLSWVWLILIALTGGHVVEGRGWPTHFPALVGPTLAALAVTVRAGGRPALADLRRRMVLVRVPARWWAMAFSPLLVLAVVVGWGPVTGHATPSAADFAAFSGLPSQWGVLGVGVAIVLLNGFGEETGWRGFALPRLQERFTPLTATLLLAVLWAGWHTPMFLVVDTFGSFGPVTTVGWVLGLTCGAIVLTWLYNRTGSILLVAVWHGTYNLISGTRAATGLLAAMSTTLVIVLAVALVALELRAGRRGAPTVLGPAHGLAGGVRPVKRR